MRAQNAHASILPACSNAEQAVHAASMWSMTRDSIN
jgi:hypothetical protein